MNNIPVAITTSLPNAPQIAARQLPVRTQLQTLWNCRWSCPPKHAADTGVRPVLVCGRTGGERCVSQCECETCPHWIYE